MDPINRLEDLQRKINLVAYTTTAASVVAACENPVFVVAFSSGLHAQLQSRTSSAGNAVVLPMDATSY
eukprot:scaffold84_cov163-Amphora_coffeaeformis.AAC.2